MLFLRRINLALSLVVHPVEGLESFVSFQDNHSFLVYSFVSFMRKKKKHQKLPKIWKGSEFFLLKEMNSCLLDGCE